jgi:tryptophan synthase alpha chain
MPYFTFGFPTIDESVEIITAIAANSDLLELGIPFSDPIADGPTIQRSTQRALDNGTSVSKCLELLEKIRTRGVDIPILLMSYFNPILAYGEERFVQDAHTAGGDGFIVPDLPPEESGQLDEISQESGLVLINFLAPTSNRDRISIVTGRAQGFIYLVSISGVTGARNSLDSSLGEFAKGIKQRTPTPVAVGFGVSSAAQAATIGTYADGVIIGSALINAVEVAENKPAAAAELLQGINQALAL